MNKKTKSMKKLMTLFWVVLFGIMLSGAQAQITLTGNFYTQNFDGIGSGLPDGWTVYTTSNNSSAATFTTAATVWSSTTGGFKNVASANELTSGATSDQQNASTNRALGVRQTGSVGDPGATFRLAIENTLGRKNFQLSFRLQSLDQQGTGRDITWNVQYSKDGTTWNTVATNPAALTTSATAFSNTAISVNFGEALDTAAAPVYIRIVALNASSGSGNRPTSAIDDFVLTWVDPTAPCDAPTVFSIEEVTNDVAVIGWNTTAIGYSFKYGIGEETLENPWTLIENATNPVVLSPLTSNTTYSYQVKSICGTDHESSWSEVQTFATEAVTTPSMSTPVTGINTISSYTIAGSYEIANIEVSGTVYNAGDELLISGLDYNIPITTTDVVYSDYETTYGIVALFTAATQTVKVEVIDYEMFKTAVESEAVPADEIPVVIQWGFTASDVQANSGFPVYADMPVAAITDAITLSSWETNGVVAGTVSYPIPATEVNLVIGNTPQLVLGSGVSNQTSSPAGNLYPIVLNQTTADEAAAVANNTYWEFSVAARSDKKLTVTELDVNLRRSTSGPNSFVFYYSLDGFATPGIPVGTASSIGTASDGEAFSFTNLSISTLDAITFRLYAWGGTAGASNSVGIGRLTGSDLIVIGSSETYVAPICNAPTTFTASDITYESATLGWDATSATYSLKYGIGEETAENTWTLVENPTNSITLSSLLSDTTYSYQVKSICDEFTGSAWSSVQTFRTLVRILPVVTTDLTTEPILEEDTAYFSVSATANDYAGTMVKIKSTFSGDTYQDGDISLWYLETEGQNQGEYVSVDIVSGEWYFNLSTGFSLADTTSNFRMIGNNPGIYNLKLDIITVSDETIIGTTNNVITIGLAPTIVSDLTTDPMFTEDTTYFSATTTTGDYAGTMVRIKSTFSGDTYQDGDISLWYLEVFGANAGQYLPATIVNGEWYFGSSTGFPLTAATSDFKVVANTAGVYDCGMEIIRVSDGKILNSTIETFTAIDRVAPTITTDLTTNPIPALEETYFTVSTTTGTYAGIMVKVKTTYSGDTYQDGDISLWYLEVNGPNAGTYLPANIENGEWVFGLSTGFPLSETTSNFKAVGNNIGTYDYQMEIIRVSDDAILGSTNGTFTVVPAPTISSDLTTAPVFTKDTTYFSASTTVGAYAGTMVRVKSTYSGDTYQDGDISLWYLEVNGPNAGQYLPATIVDGEWYFGPSTGFPLSDATSNFRIVANTAGVYNYEMQIIRVSDGVELGSAGETFTAVDRIAPTIVTDLTADPVFSLLPVDFTVTTTAGNYEGYLAKVKVTISGDDYQDGDILVWYLETDGPNAGTYMPATIVNGEWLFGPSTGFSIINTTYQFRIEATTAGEYDYTLDLINVSDNAVLATTNGIFIATAPLVLPVVNTPVAEVNKVTVSTTAGTYAITKLEVDGAVYNASNELLVDNLDFDIPVTDGNMIYTDYQATYGATITFTAATQTFEIAITDPAVFRSAVAAIATTADKLPTRIHWWFVAHDVAGNVSGSMGTETEPATAVQIDMPVDVSNYPTITTDLVASSNVLETIDFSVSTVGNDFLNEMVNVRLTLSGDDYSDGDLSLSYLEVNGPNAGQYLPATIVDGEWIFGPSTGFPLINGTSQFKITANAPGEYDYTLEIVSVSDAGVLATTNGTYTANPLATSITTPPTATDIQYGSSLSVSTLEGGVASVPGLFTWADPDSIPYASGNYEVIFTPTDPNYATVTGIMVNVTVHFTAPTLLTNNLAASFEAFTKEEFEIAVTAGSYTGILSKMKITFHEDNYADGNLELEYYQTGEWVTATITDGVWSFYPQNPDGFPLATENIQLRVKANVIGTYTYTVNLESADARFHYNISDADGFEVVKATPVLIAAPTATVVVDHALSTATLSGGEVQLADGTVVAGTFTWVDPQTVVSASGTYPMIFTPTNNNINTINTNVQVTAVLIYRVTATAGANGTISPVGDSLVVSGDNITYTITPNTGYHIAELLVDGQPATITSSYTFENVTATHTISVTFEINSYTISASVGTGNGTISPVGDSVVTYGSTVEYTFTPNAHWHVLDVKIDGVSQGAIQDYTFTNVDNDHTIVVDFRIDTIKITATAVGNGTITPSGEFYVNYGSSRTFTMAPGTGYYIDDVVVNDISEGAVESITIQNITEEKTIVANFSIYTYTITATASTGGTISEAHNPYEYGSNALFTFTPDAGYEVIGLIVDGISLGYMESYEFINITANHTIHAVFDPASCDLMATNLTATNVTSTSALLSWSNEGATYTVRYKKEGDTDYTIVENVTTNSLQLNDLTSDVRYHWNVQCLCSEINLGEWSAEGTFNTLGTGISEITISSVKVYSNENNVYIVNEALVPLKAVQIFDMFGKIVYEGTAVNSTEVIPMATATGTYVVRIVTDKQTGSYKVYIQN